MATTATLLLAVFCLGTDMYVVAALIPTMAADLGEPGAALGLLVSAYALPNAVLAPVFGPLSDRLGRRIAMLGGMAFFAVTVAGTAIAPTLPILVGLRALNGLGAAVVMPAVFASWALRGRAGRPVNARAQQEAAPRRRLGGPRRALLGPGSGSPELSPPRGGARLRRARSRPRS
jgi:MFS family permease